MSWAEELPPGTIVGDTSLHDPARRIRFGVVLAPEPSERVRRITSDDPAIWRPGRRRAGARSLVEAPAGATIGRPRERVEHYSAEVGR
jgi:hypothetical protein